MAPRPGLEPGTYGLTGGNLSLLLTGDDRYVVDVKDLFTCFGLIIFD